ncbi:hypothetical protein GCM10010123_38920 [Pilimelia anulata]|uniref:Uncharacterized protein n=1 Tax=Pilimelia anulata TaxID=53371 RepID=A0A8J3B9E3_9ACTN|nr:hypothetical protein GCM10010123_38920 [Pilimelia anulata]
MTFAGLAVAVPASARPSARADGSIAGVLRDAAGKPVADARVAAYAPGDDGGQVASSDTDEAGAFTLTDVPAGRYQLQLTGGFGQAWADGRLDRESATVYDVRAGAATRVTIKLPPTGTVAGKLLDHAGTPVADADVVLEDPAGGEALGSTGADGGYAFPVIPGTHRLAFRIDSVVQYAPRQRDPELGGAFTVTAGRTLTVNETLLPTGRVNGRVADARGRPYGEGDVELVDEQGDGSTAAVDSDGTFDFGRVFAGRYTGAIRLDGGTQWIPGALAPGDARQHTLAAGGQWAIDERLLPLGGLRGRVTDAAGHPAAGIPVEVHRGAAMVATALTDDDGGYALAAVLAGEHRVALVRGDRTPVRQWMPGRPSPDDTTIHAVAADRTTVVDDVLAPVGSVSGRLTHPDGTPVAAASVRLYHRGAGDHPVASLATDDDGRFLADTAFTGAHKVRFVVDSRRGAVEQWARGKPTMAAADWIDVAADAESVVNDVLVVAATRR